MNEEKLDLEDLINQWKNLNNQQAENKPDENTVLIYREKKNIGRKIIEFLENNQKILYTKTDLIKELIELDKENEFSDLAYNFRERVTKDMFLIGSRVEDFDFIELVYKNPEYFSDTTIKSLLLHLALEQITTEDKKKEIIDNFLNDSRVLEIALAKVHDYDDEYKYIKGYFCENFETLFREFSTFDEKVANGFRKYLVQGIVDQEITIDKDGNFKTKNSSEPLDIKTAKKPYMYYMDEEFAKDLLIRKYQLKTFADVKNFYNDIDTILKNDIENEGTVINGLCNCKWLGKMLNFREANDIYGPNTQLEYLKSLAYSVIKDRLEEIKKEREEFINNPNEKKKEINDMFEGWGKDGEQK